MTDRWYPDDELDLDAVEAHAELLAAVQAEAGLPLDLDAAAGRLTTDGIAATDEVIDRLSRGFGAADGDPAAAALAELVRVIDLDQDHAQVDIGALVDQVAWVPRRELVSAPAGVTPIRSLRLETLPIDAPVPQQPQRSSSVRHMRDARPRVRTLRMAPLSGVAAAAVLLIAGASVGVTDFFGSGGTSTSAGGERVVVLAESGRVVDFDPLPISEELATRDNVLRWLDRASRAGARGETELAAQLVDRASRALTFFPAAEAKVLAQKVEQTAAEAGLVVAPPGAVVTGRPVTPGAADPTSPVFVPPGPVDVPSVIVTMPPNSPTFPADPPPVVDPPVVTDSPSPSDQPTPDPTATTPDTTPTTTEPPVDPTPTVSDTLTSTEQPSTPSDVGDASPSVDTDAGAPAGQPDAGAAAGTADGP